MANEIKLVIHDGDGNLYDTREHITKTTVAAFDACGSVISNDDVYDRFSAGVSLHRIFADLGPGLDPEVLEERFYYFDRTIGYDTINPCQGLFSMLSTLEAQGAQIAVASNRDRASTIAILRHLDILDNFVSSDLVACPPEHPNKPDPSQLHFLMRAAHVEPFETVMVGDTPGDILAGKNASVHATIGFTGGFGSADALRVAGADVLIDDLALLPELIIDLSS